MTPTVSRNEGLGGAGGAGGAGGEAGGGVEPKKDGFFDSNAYELRCISLDRCF